MKLSEILLEDLPLSNSMVTFLKKRFDISNASELFSLSATQLSIGRPLGKIELEKMRKLKRLIYRLINENSEELRKSYIEKEKQNYESEERMKMAVLPLTTEINQLRTILLEQYRLLQAIQLEKSPDGLLRKINEKIPGFSAIICDLNKKLEE